MTSYKAKIIVLKHRNLFEADRLITAFSFEYGKIRFIARGIRKTKSKYAGSLEPFCQSSVVISKGRNLDILSSSDLEINYLRDAHDITKIRFACTLAEIMEKIGDDQQKNPSLFTLLQKTLENIDKISFFYLKSFFLINLFDQTGLLPEISTCVHCREKPIGNVYFSNQAGGILDEDCLHSFDDGYEISLEVVKYLNFTRNQTLENVSKVRLAEETKYEVLSLLDAYFYFAYQISLRSSQI